MTKPHYKLVPLHALRIGDEFLSPSSGDVMTWTEAHMFFSTRWNDRYVALYEGETHVWKKTTLQTVQCSRPDVGRPHNWTHHDGYTGDLPDCDGQPVRRYGRADPESAPDSCPPAAGCESVPEPRASMRMIRGSEIKQGDYVAFHVPFPPFVSVNNTRIVLDPDCYYKIVNTVTK